MKENYLFFKKAILALCLIAVCWLPAKADALLGDVDGDGEVNIADVAKLIDYLLTDNPTGLNLQNADVNQDGQIDIADVASLIDLLLLMPANPHQEHEWVDLGLPSGTLWATCNVGASAPEDYGDYFAWGETAPKSYYDWSTYKWCNGSLGTLTKYCTSINYGYNEFVDNKKELEPDDDAARVNWGKDWCMPTRDQLQELIDNSTWELTKHNGVNGHLLTGPNGNTLFLPAAGLRLEDSLINAGSYGYYWSRHLLYNLFPPSPAKAHEMIFWSMGCRVSFRDRNCGQTVRAVRVSQN